MNLINLFIQYNSLQHQENNNISNYVVQIVNEILNNTRWQ